MPRQPRLDFPGQYYHVMVRGIEKSRIFNDDTDRSNFLERLSKSLAKTATQCLAWALMSNHIHLFILSGVKGLAAFMHPLLSGYVGAFNRRYRRVGHLVQNRYKSILCQDDPYFLELVRYIALNPVRAGLIKTPEQLAAYPWTGHSAILGNCPRPWQATEVVLSHFGAEISSSQKAYERFVVDGWGMGYRKNLEGGGLIRSLGGEAGLLEARVNGERHAYDSQILGDGKFVESILKASEKLDRQQKALKKSGMNLERLETIIAELIRVDSTAIRKPNRERHVSEARALLIYCGIEFLGKRPFELATFLRINSSSVSEARRRGAKLAEAFQIEKQLFQEKQ